MISVDLVLLSGMLYVIHGSNRSLSISFVRIRVFCFFFFQFCESLVSVTEETSFSILKVYSFRYQIAFCD